MDLRTDTKLDTNPAQPFLEKSEWLPVRLAGICLQNFSDDPDYYLGGKFEKEMFKVEGQPLLIVGLKMDELRATLWRATVEGAISTDDFYRLSESLNTMSASLGAA